MEELLEVSPEALESDAELSVHLKGCSRCRKSLENARLAGSLLSVAGIPEVPSTEAFVTRVMARVREADAQAARPTVWATLEPLASRFTIVAAMVLLALSVFLGEFSPALRQIEMSSISEVTADWPEPPAQPATQDEVLMSLSEAETSGI
jgi:hypothetical protein